MHGFEIWDEVCDLASTYWGLVGNIVYTGLYRDDYCLPVFLAKNQLLQG